jgi:branched-chain amino acid transport system substrate-binding protein
MSSHITANRPSRAGRFSAALLSLALVLLASCGSSSSSPSALATAAAFRSRSPIVIGAAVAESGVISPYDLPPLTAVKLAIADINERGGVLGRPLKLVVADMQSVPSDGPRAALTVLAAGAQFVIVSCDYDNGAPAAVTAQAKGVVAFSTCAGAPQFGPQGVGPLAYTMATAAQTEGVIMSDFAASKGCKRGYLFEDTDLQYFRSVAAGFRQAFSETGGKLIATSTFTQASVNPPAVVDKFLAVTPRPQCVLLAFNPSFGGGVLRQLRASGYTGSIFGTNAWDGDYWKKLSPHLSNFYYSAFGSIYGDDPNPAANRLVARWRAANGGALPTNDNLITGYSVIQAFARAVTAARSTQGSAVAAELNKFKNVPLLVGPTTFTRSVHIAVVRRMAVMQIRDGKTSFLKMLSPAQTPTITP